MDTKSNELLLTEIRKLAEAVTKLNKHQSAWYSFGRGIMSALGYFVGAAILVGVIVYLLQRVDLVPIIGEWLGGVINETIKNSMGNQLMFPNK